VMAIGFGVAVALSEAGQWHTMTAQQRQVFDPGALAVSLTAVIGVGLGGVIRHTAGAATTLALIIIGGLTVGQFLPAVLGGYAAVALAAASLRASHSDA